MILQTHNPNAVTITANPRNNLIYRSVFPISVASGLVKLGIFPKRDGSMYDTLITIINNNNDLDPLLFCNYTIVSTLILYCLRFYHFQFSLLRIYIYHIAHFFSTHCNALFIFLFFVNYITCTITLETRPTRNRYLLLQFIYLFNC